jgi:hypothetical protein
MGTLIERHPLAFLGVAMAFACLLAIVYVALADYMVPDFSWLAGIPDSGAIRACAH